MFIMNIEWKNKAKQILKDQLSLKRITHEELSQKLCQIGIKETKASIDSKISRGTFSASFFVQCLASIGCDSISISTTYKMESELIKSETNLVEYKGMDDKNIYFDNDGIRYVDIEKNRLDKIKRNKVVSLFTGAGGLDIGLEEAGFETVVCIENDADCRETLRFNRPNWKLFEKANKFEEGILGLREPGNVREISVEELLEFAKLERGEAALVVGGAPCQPFSNIGKKQGRNDQKNGDLFLEFVRIVKGVEPQAFIFENVAGITQSKHNSVIKYMIDSFSGSGYGISYNILNAADYGVPQRRERFFLIGIKDSVLPAFPLPTHTKNKESWIKFISKLNKKPYKKPELWKTVSQAFKELPANYTKRDDYAVMNCSAKVVHRMSFIEQGQNFKILPLELRPNCWKNGKHQGQDTFGRLILDYPSVTIRTAAYNPSKGRYIHPTENRGLDTIEMASLQDFPIDWHFKCIRNNKITLVSAGKQIGNAVPPGLANAIGKAIKFQIAKKESKEFSEMHQMLEK